MLTRDFVRALPKAELHANDDLPAPPPWTAAGFRFGDFTQFRGAVQTCMGCLLDAPVYGVAAGAIFRDLSAQNVRYVEISFDIGRPTRSPSPRCRRPRDAVLGELEALAREIGPGKA
jgi:hypothetical protein